MVDKNIEIIGSGNTSYGTVTYERENGTTLNIRFVGIEKLDPDNLNGEYRLIGQGDDKDYYVRDRKGNFVVSRSFMSDLLINLPDSFVEKMVKTGEQLNKMRN